MSRSVLSFAFLLSSALMLSGCGQPSAAQSDLPTLHPQAVSGSNIDTWRKQVIYLTIPDRFSNGNTANDSSGQAGCLNTASATLFHGGDLQGMRNKLSYIRDLGATTLWITPVYRQVGLVNGTSCGYHGYWADYTSPDDTAIEPKMGTGADLSGLISDLHAGGQKFMMDMVVNHAGYGARIVSQQPSWFHSACSGDDINCPLAGLPDFAQENAAVATYLTNLSKTWTSTYAIDAIRMDTAKHVLLTYWQNSWVPGVLAARPNTFLLAEAFLDSSASQLKPFLDAGFDSTFAFPTRTALVSSLGKAGSLDLLAGKVQDTVSTLGLDRALLQVNLLDNHDVGRFVNEPGTSVSEADIRTRYGLALGALMTLPGIPQLYYGDELGVYGGNDPDNRKDMPAWAWTDAGRNAVQTGYLAGGGTPKSTYDLTKRLIAIRQANEALWKGSYAEMWRPNGGQNAYAYYRGSNGSRVIVAMNSSTSSAALSLDIQGNTGIGAADRTALTNGTVFTDQLGKGAPASATVSAGKLNVTLPAGTMGIYVAGGAPSTVSVGFQVVASTSVGQNIFLVGDHSTLGAWNTGSALSMTPSNCSGTTCTWNTTVNLPPSTAIAYKYIRKDSAGAVTWEGGNNRTATTPASGTVTLSGTWQ